MRNPAPASWRAVPTTAAVLVFALVVGGIIAPLAAYRISRGSSLGSTPHRTHVPRGEARGQRTRASVLPVAARRFATGPGGWSGSGAAVGWLPRGGRSGAGAVRLRWSASLDAQAQSPTFRVVTGARYVATGWVHPTSGKQLLDLGLRFYDRNGRPVLSAVQDTLRTADGAKGWTQLEPVAGFAPYGAVLGRVVVLRRAPVAASPDVLDDVTVTATTGLPAPVIGPLSTRGADILDAHGRRVVLRGIQLGGLKVPGWRPGTIKTHEIAVAQRWGANFARVPLAENPALPGDCSYRPQYLRIVDRVVHDLTSRGMVALLDLHTQALHRCDAYAPQAMPDDGALRFWRLMAERYAHNPLVAFDLYNEPHGITDDVWLNGGQVTSYGVAYHSPGMRALYAAVRSTGADNLVFFSGNAFATVLPSNAPLHGVRNVVYAAHAYTCPHALPSAGGVCHGGPGGLLDPSHILDRFVAAGARVPVVVTEFGWPSPNDGTYISNVIRFVTEHQWAGWDVFLFNGGTAGVFSLVRQVGRIWQPSPAGMAAIVAMRQD